MTNIPDFSSASTDQEVAALKARCEDARALGIVQSGESELMIIYDGELLRSLCVVDLYPSAEESTGDNKNMLADYLIWQISGVM